MNNMHFKIEEPTVNGMFTWSMKVELCAVESCNWDVWVKEWDRLSFNAVEILLLGFTFGNIKEESVSNLIKFQLFLFLIDHIIMEIELFVLEILEDWHFRA